MSHGESEADRDTAGDTGPLGGSVDASSSAASLIAGPLTLANRYEILSLAGVGGMGAVYRARDKELDEIVALKMLRRELTNDEAVLDRFRSEVKLARRVTHKNVARTFDIGEHDGDKFLTMEFVDGQSLAALLARRGKLALARVVEILEPICAGLAAAHAAGVIHRDLKPENILIARDGRVVITDFGIARARLGDGVAGRKTEGVTLGTPAYMAPEQVDGRAELDGRADIYSLGVILYEMLTGRPAWSGETVYAVAMRRLVEPPPDPQACANDVPDAAAKVTMRCMARDPAGRFATAAELGGALAGLTLPLSPGIWPPPAAPSSPSMALVSSLTPASMGIDAKVVAVLPLKNQGPPEDEYLADGLTDDLIDNLSMTRGIRVRSRGMVMGFRGIDRDPRELGRELGVQVVVLGSVRRAGERLRVQARVVSVADGFQLWAKRFDCPAAEFLSVGDEMVRAVAEALTCSFDPPKARQAPADPAAIDLYLRARHAYHNGWRGNSHVSVDLFRQALARAPDDPMILSGHAMALMRVFAHDEGANDAGEEGKIAAERALSLAPQLGEARVALATYLLNVGDAVGAAREVVRALSSAPSLADAHDLAGRLLVEAGATRAGTASLRRALSFEPRLTVAALALARVHALRGEVGLADELVRVGADDPVSETVRSYTRVRFAMWNGDKEGLKVLIGNLEASGMSLGRLEVLRGYAGGPVDPKNALDITRLATKSGGAARRRSFYSQVRAEIHAFLGEEDVALSALEDADQAQLFDIEWIASCRVFDSLRENPRFVTVQAHVAERGRAVLEAFGIEAG